VTRVGSTRIIDPWSGDFMKRRQFLIASGTVLTASAVLARSTDSRFSATISTKISGKTVRLSFTGSALRKKYGFSVYTIASYVQEGAKVADAEALARADIGKILALIFERDVDGQTIATSFRGSIAANHPAPAFSAELDKLANYFLAHNASQGDRLWLTHIPGVGLRCQFQGDAGILIESVPFARAIWETYLGPNNLGVAIKEGLTSRLR
jgi:hypothetical protein